MDKEYKILVLVMPAYGHLNPMTSFINELAKTKNLKIFFPGNEVDRKLIEGTKARFERLEVEVFDKALNMNEMRHDIPVDKMMLKLMRITSEVLPFLVELVEREQFDLIIYDFATTYARFLKSKLKNLQKAGQLKCKMPRFIMFSPSFMVEKDIYPNKAEPPMFPMPKMTFFLSIKLILITIKYAFFCWMNGIDVENPALFPYRREEFNMCGIIPELQPRAHLLSKSIVYVGSCASEEFRKHKEFEEPLKSLLAPFEPSNPVPLIDMRVDEDFLAKRKTKLIYVSFGTLFNEDTKLYLTIIDAFNSLEQSETNQFKLLISTGDKAYAKFQEMIKRGEYKNQDNILLMNKVPQLEVLKRASAFVTHSGQGSTNEAIHYGVPMICIPVFGDQPAVAHRVADELGLGIRFVYDELNSAMMKEGLLKILTDRSYLERVSLFAQLSRKHNGPQTATNLVIQFLQKLHS